MTYTQLTAANFDAATFREYMAAEYGLALEYGMTTAKFDRCIRDAKHLARRMGRPADDATLTEIFNNARRDRELMDLAS